MDLFDGMCLQYFTNEKLKFAFIKDRVLPPDPGSSLHTEIGCIYIITQTVHDRHISAVLFLCYSIKTYHSIVCN